MVLDQGELKEFDSPAQLLTKPGGVFRGLMEEAGRWGALVGAYNSCCKDCASPANWTGCWRVGGLAQSV
jgi:hypothetical protein